MNLLPMLRVALELPLGCGFGSVSHPFGQMCSVQMGVKAELCRSKDHLPGSAGEGGGALRPVSQVHEPAQPAVSQDSSFITFSLLGSVDVMASLALCAHF